MRWRRRKQHAATISADELRDRVLADMARFYDVTAETAATARKLWADHDTTEGRYDFTQWLNWVALQTIEQLGPLSTADEMLAKYRKYIDGEWWPDAGR